MGTMEWLPDVLRYGQAGGIPWKREERLPFDVILRMKIVYGPLRSRLTKRLSSESARCIPTSPLLTSSQAIESKWSQFGTYSILKISAFDTGSQNCGIMPSLYFGTSAFHRGLGRRVLPAGDGARRLPELLRNALQLVRGGEQFPSHAIEGSFRFTKFMCPLQSLSYALMSSFHPKVIVGIVHTLRRIKPWL